jgi:rhomboid protease GluP
MRLQIKLRLNVLTFLLFLNSLIFALAFLVDLTLGFDQKLFHLFGGEITTDILKGDWWLLLTASFFHISLVHFALNMFSLYRMGELILNYYGGRKLFVTYILGGIGASLLSTAMAVVFRDPVLSLGASGSIFALVGLLLGGSVKKYRLGVSLPFGPMDVLPVFILPFLVGFMPGLQINNWAHIGGLIIGFVLGLIFHNSMSRHLSKVDKHVENFMYYLCILILAVCYLLLFADAYRLIYK